MGYPGEMSAAANRLLAQLPRSDLRRLLPKLQPVSLAFNQVLYEARSPIDYAYFPTGAVLSALTLMANGSAIEVATIGSEGMAGMPLVLESDFSPHRMIAQIPGECLRIRSSALKSEICQCCPLKLVLLRYQVVLLAQISQAVACNGLHSLKQRCCRWLLETQDRVQSNVVVLTHEFLSMILGVRRSSVSEVLMQLQREKMISYTRGKITIANRKKMEADSCECYKTICEEYQRLFGSK